MYGAILGDIIGSPYEFDRGNKTKDFPLFSRRSWYTDDSVMTIAVAEALMDNKGKSEEETKAALAASMQKWGKIEPDAGYGNMFYRWLQAENPQPYGSYGNGSAMRVSSAGWLYDTLEETREKARWTAEVTHNHPEGIKGAEATASAIFLARTGRTKEEIRDFINGSFGYDLSRTCDEIRPNYHHVESCQETVPEAIITELYTNVSESDFNTFSVYLEQQEAQLADYKAEKGVLTAEIRAKGASFSLQYDSKTGEAKVTYPSGAFDERMKSAKTHYDTGKELLNAGKTDEALAEFLSIPQYSEYVPVADLLETNENLTAAAAAAAREAKYAPYKEAGSVVSFGTYQQTKEGTDQTPIEWIVLDYDEVNHKTLLLSRYGLEAMPYNTEYTDITWEECTLRTWLNGEFLNKAFSAAEQSAILMTQVDNSKSQGYSKWDTDGGNNTEDRIFLLSYAEANRYLGVTYEDSNNLKSRVAPTAYALAQGAHTLFGTEDGAAAGWWWLRSPGDLQSYAARVGSDGSLLNSRVTQDGFVVRPAFWLNLESDIF